TRREEATQANAFGSSTDERFPGPNQHFTCLGVWHRFGDDSDLILPGENERVRLNQAILLLLVHPIMPGIQASQKRDSAQPKDMQQYARARDAATTSHLLSPKRADLRAILSQGLSHANTTHPRNQAHLAGNAGPA